MCISYESLYKIVAPKFSQASYDLAMQRDLESLSSSETTSCLQCIKWLAQNRSGDPGLPLLLNKFGIGA